MNLLLSVLLTASVLFAGPLDNLKAGEWYEVPGSHLASVPPGGNVIAPWCGGAFDTKRNQLIVWGGGHGDYSGNEIYAFNLDSLKWFRLTSPSSTVGVTGCPLIMPDSQPVSRHTYAGMAYSDTLDKIVDGGGFTWPCAYGDPWVWFFDYQQNKWLKNTNLGFGSRGIMAYDPSTGHLWCRGGGYPGFFEHNPRTNVWTGRDPGNFFGQIMDVDPDNKWLVGLNRGNVAYYPINGNTGAAGTYNTSGDTASINSAMPDGDYKTPGFVWDPIIKKFVAWNGGANVYTLDASTHAFTRVSPAATNTVIPTAAAAQGTYGRFRYSPKNNVYVVVNSINENVFIYRLTAGTAAETKSGKSPLASMMVSPNPVQSGGHLLIRGLTNGNIRITDARGRVIDRFAATDKATWRTPSHLTPGLYFVQWTHDKGMALTRPIVVVK